MSLTMRVKSLLRRLGYDVVKYHPFYETVVKPLGIKTVLDIGANEGTYASEARALFPNAAIHAFEPLIDCFTTLKKTHQHDPHLVCHHIALGDTSDTTTMERSSFHPSSSLLPMSGLHRTLYPKSADTCKEEVRIERLDGIAPTLALTEPLLVKMDVQGFEGEVIAGGKNTIRKAAVVICEISFVPLYEGQALFDDIYQALRKLGFVYYGSVARHYSKRTNTLIYEDAVFIKPEFIRA